MPKQTVAIGDTGGQLVAKLDNNFTELYNGSGANRYIIQPTDVINVSAWWTANMIYGIVDDYDFGGHTIILPPGIILDFQGGIFSNGTIIGNDSIFMTNGLSQCFETDLTLTGTWSVDNITIQNYGATSNPNRTTYSNSSTAAIQKCLDSIFNVIIPSGYYYLATGLTISKPKTITLSGLFMEDDVFAYSLSHACIYTDQDIDLVTITSGNVYWIGGSIDLSHVAAHTHSAFRYDCSYNITRGKIKTNIYGSKSALLTGANTGNAILFDTINATANAETHFIEIEGYFKYVNYGVWIQGLNITYPLIYLADINTNIITWGLKHPIKYEGGSRSWIKAIIEDEAVLSLLEIDTPMIYTGAEQCVIDCVFYDWDETAAHVGPPYLHWVSIENYADKNKIAPGVAMETLLRHYSSVIQHVSFTDTSFSSPARGFRYFNNKANYWDLSFISRLENILSYIDKTETVTIKKYDGTGKDFDADLTETIGAETASVTLTNSINLFRPYGEAMSVEFTNNPTKATDYVEVVINFAVHKTIQWFCIAYHPNIAGILRFQLIILDDVSGNPIAFNHYETSYPTRYEGRIIDFGDRVPYQTHKIIVRFIGTNLINTSINFSELISIGHYILRSPIVDIGGGQTIYGTLGLTGALLQTELSGALTDGAPTDVEIDTITGSTPAGVGVGWKCTIKDTTGTGLIYLVESDGANWFYSVMTKAV